MTNVSSRLILKKVIKISADKEKYRFYLAVGLVYLLLFLIEVAIANPETFLQRAVNTIWRTPYIVLINFIFLEHVLPSIKLKWTSILLAPLLLAGQLFLCSVGLTMWRWIGIALNIHTSYVTHDSLEFLLKAIRTAVSARIGTELHDQIESVMDYLGAMVQWIEMQKTQVASLEKRRQELINEESLLSQQIAADQSRWSDVNSQLDDLERSLAPSDKQ